MKKIALIALAMVGLATLAPRVRAVWDSTLGNMPSYYPLCWGLNSTACIYGNTNGGNYVRIQTGGIDAIQVNGSQQVTVPGTLSVTGAVTASAGINSSAGPATLQIQTTTQLALDVYPVGTFTLVEESTNTGALYPSFVTNAYNICVTTVAAATGSTNAVYVAVATGTLASGGPAAGGACNK